jgi:hypothetical protein
MSANKTLCDFVVTELIHDYGKSIDGTDPGPNNINMISSKRYKNNKIIFDNILSSGVPNCPISAFTKYDEPQILKHIAGSKIKEQISNKLIDGKLITTLNGNIYHVNISDKKLPKNENSGEEFFTDLNFGHFSGTDSPVILADTFSWVYRVFKRGNPSNKNIYIYNPLVVIADSASKANISDKKEMYEYFVDSNGVKLINVIDNSQFEAPLFNNVTDKTGFFSNYRVTTELNNYDENAVKGKDIKQTWSNLNFQGQGQGNIIRIPANKLNNKTNTFKRMTNWINNTTTPTVISNAAALSNLNKNDPINKKIRELFNVELQSKRSGDWLPVIYILNYNPNNVKLKTYNDPDNIENLDNNIKQKFFKKDNMYILTLDTPLVAFSLYCGVNVLYITADGKLVKFEADSLNNSFQL